MLTCAGNGCSNRFQSYHGLQRYCSSTCRDRMKQQRSRTAKPQRHKVIARRANLKRKYGISIADYDRMLAQQGGRCAICRRLPGKTRLAVDHDHITGKIRGLLCTPCNRHVGYFELYWTSFVMYMITTGISRGREAKRTLAYLHESPEIAA